MAPWPVCDITCPAIDRFANSDNCPALLSSLMQPRAGPALMVRSANSEGASDHSLLDGFDLRGRKSLSEAPASQRRRVSGAPSNLIMQQNLSVASIVERLGCRKFRFWPKVYTRCAQLERYGRHSVAALFS